jgi:hypothetical protein
MRKMSLKITVMCIRKGMHTQGEIRKKVPQTTLLFVGLLTQNIYPSFTSQPIKFTAFESHFVFGYIRSTQSRTGVFMSLSLSGYTFGQYSLLLSDCSQSLVIYPIRLPKQNNTLNTSLLCSYQA